MKENKEIGIDVVQLFKVLWKKKIAIILTAIVAAVIAFGVSSFVLTPEYSSTTRIYVVNRNQSENAGLTNQDLQAGTYLVKDYKEIILSQDVEDSGNSTCGYSYRINYCKKCTTRRSESYCKCSS